MSEPAQDHHFDEFTRATLRDVATAFNLPLHRMCPARTGHTIHCTITGNDLCTCFNDLNLYTDEAIG